MEDDIHKAIEEHVAHFLRKEYERKEEEGGNKLALLDCINFCDEYHLTVPPWAPTSQRLHFDI